MPDSRSKSRAVPPRSGGDAVDPRGGKRAGTEGNEHEGQREPGLGIEPREGQAFRSRGRLSWSDRLDPGLFCRRRGTRLSLYDRGLEGIAVGRRWSRHEGEGHRREGAEGELSHALSVRSGRIYG